jgi:hypothetical protein
MKFARLILPCAVVLGAAAPVLAQYGAAPTETSSAQSGSMSATTGSQIFTVAAQHGSNETGTVTLGPSGTGKTAVSIDITGAPAEPQPAHIHKGTCANLDPAPAYPLNNVVNGHSKTVVNVPLASLTAGGFAVYLHQSLTDIKDYVACSDLTSANAAAKSATPQTSASPKN